METLVGREKSLFFFFLFSSSSLFHRGKSIRINSSIKISYRWKIPCATRSPNYRTASREKLVELVKPQRQRRRRRSLLPIRTQRFNHGSSKIRTRMKSRAVYPRSRMPPTVFFDFDTNEMKNRNSWGGTLPRRTSRANSCKQNSSSL